MPTDDVTPDFPEEDGVAEPELPEVDVEGARLLANEARDRLRPDGFTDDEIDAWTRSYFESDAGGQGEGDVDGLVAFIEAEQAAGRSPS
ncbi:MAG: hypothetical protein U0Q07_03570 [Acidimicrobiales bacterium]